MHSEREFISRAVAESLRQRKTIAVRMRDPLEELIVQGIVEQADGRRFKVDGEWFDEQDIEGALSEEEFAARFSAELK